VDTPGRHWRKVAALTCSELPVVRHEHGRASLCHWRSPGCREEVCGPRAQHPGTPRGPQRPPLIPCRHTGKRFAARVRLRWRAGR
jgi:hypothetical protein